MADNRRMVRWSALALILAAAVAAATDAAQGPEAAADSVLLVAKPGLADPRFSETVVLVVRTPALQTVGVIINRPLRLKLSEIVDDEALAKNHRGPVFFGGPVMERTLVALFRSAQAPEASAFHVLEDVYLSIHPANVERLLRSQGAGYRIYAGFSGWAPQQLESEIERDGWYVLPASAELLFRADTAGLWEELLERARGKRAALYSFP
jgi:putative transcriptional regulator